ncbi:hypothetical protein AB8896_20980 [Yersinia enterocolitica]|uniref:hypothetical protein n=1 Tax=Yersinia enterocolitica TaxID=630 RepID=UPI003D079602
MRTALIKKQKIKQLNEIVYVLHMSREGVTPPIMTQAAVYAFYSVIIILALYTLDTLTILYFLWVPVLVFILTLKLSRKSKSCNGMTP